MQVRWIEVPLCALLAAAACGQSAGTLEGLVRDGQGHAIGGSTVYLKPQGGGATMQAHADAAGKYRFTGVAAGAYLLRAEGGTSQALTLDGTTVKTADLTVEYAFFDQPNFIVAGVTDPAARGGHGSDTVLRSAEALAKATVELAAGPPGKFGEGDALEKVRAYQRAAELDASEPNLFAWGTELLVHRADGPAAEVFGKGHRLFPRSVRMLLGLGAAWYARGEYEQAAQDFFAACDLDPGDRAPYLFLGKVQSVEMIQLDGYLSRLARFAARYPDDAWANYYYGVALWKQRKSPDDSGTLARARELLEKAVRLDPAMGAADLQLGIICAAAGEDGRAIAAYRRAIEVSPAMDEPHYRLGQIYAKNGEKEKARRELEIYRTMSSQMQEQRERERREVQQFVIQLREGGAH